MLEKGAECVNIWDGVRIYFFPFWHLCVSKIMHKLVHSVSECEGLFYYYYFFNILERLFVLPKFQLYSLYLIGPIFLLLSPCLPTATHLSLPSPVSTKCSSFPQNPFFSLIITLNLEKKKRPNASANSGASSTFPGCLAALGALDQNSQITLLIAGFTAVSFWVLNDVSGVFLCKKCWWQWNLLNPLLLTLMNYFWALQ